MPKQRHKSYYKRGVFKLKTGGPRFRPRGKGITPSGLFSLSIPTFDRKPPEADAPQVAPFITPEKLHQGRR